MLRFIAYEPVEKAHKRLKSKVPKKEHMRRTDALAAKMQRSISADIFRGIKKFKKRISREALQTAWEQGRYDQLEREVAWDKLPEDIEPVRDTLKGNMLRASKIMIPVLPPLAQKHLRWDISNPRIRHFADHHIGNLVRKIEGESKQAIRDVVARGFSKVMSPKQAAQEIVDHIGLLPRQNLALRNFANTLMDLGHTPQNILAMSSKYHDRLLMDRSMTIARTESRRLTNHSQNMVIQESANQGLIDRERSKRIWVVDGMPCEICEPMDGEETGLDDPWDVDTPQGVVSVDIPSDIHPNCECIFTVEVE